MIAETMEEHKHTVLETSKNTEQYDQAIPETEFNYYFFCQSWTINAN